MLKEVNKDCYLRMLDFYSLQDDDEADTVGCCTLKVENVKAIAPSSLEVHLLEF